MPMKKIIRSALSARIYNKRMTGVTHLLSLLLVFCNVGILMKTKHFRVRYERQFPDVVHVWLVISLGRCVICTTVREPLVKEPQKIMITLIMYIPHCYWFKIFRSFWLAQIPRLIYHNQPALTTFGKCEQCTINSRIRKTHGSWMLSTVLRSMCKKKHLLKPCWEISQSFEEL